MFCLKVVCKALIFEFGITFLILYTVLYLQRILYCKCILQDAFSIEYNQF